MKDEFLLEGFWRLPDRPDDEIFGRLKFVPGDKLELELQGVLNSPPEWNHISPPDFIEPPLILGVESKGSEITLYRCHQIGHSLSGSGLHKTTFTADVAFIGVHFEKEDDVSFTMLSVRFSNLEEWSNRRPFTSEHPENDWKKLVIRYEHPDSVVAVINDYEIRIAFYGPNESNYGRKCITVSYETKVEIFSQSERPFKDYLPIIRRLQDFFSLAMGMPTYPIAIMGISNVGKEVAADGQEFHRPIDIYYLVPWWPDELKENHYFQMLFGLPTIETNFEAYIRNWMEKFELLEPVINLYFSVLYNPHSYAELKFLSLAQAIETYHRRVYGGKYQDDEEYLTGLYEKLVEAIPNELDDSFKKSLKGKLKYGNEFSLRTRLRKILESVSTELDFDFVQSGKRQAAFISKVVDTRNYWTHYSSELAANAAQTGEERLVLITSLQLLLEVCLLKELGFDTALIRELIQRSYRFRLLQQRNKIES